MKAIAIDGPSGAGKSTAARAAAKQLGYLYVDTGAMYRAIGCRLRAMGVSQNEEEEVARALKGLKLTLSFEGGDQRVFVNGEDMTGVIRTPEASRAASDFSKLPCVRQFLFRLQQDLGREQNVVMDGRDIGTVVLPWAQTKIFLTASAEERARRRFLELQAKGQDVSYEQILSDVRWRDEQDSTRKTAPLRQAEDAVLLDSTGLSLEQGGGPHCGSGRRGGERMKHTPLYGFGKIFAQPLVYPFIPYRTQGRENVPKDRNFILCSNHLGISDPLRLASIEKRQIFFFSKAELFQNKALAWLLRSLGCIPVQRGRGDVGAIDHASEVLENGGIMGIFIEGTRSRTGEFLQPKAGVVMLAYQHHVPILPVCITPVGSKRPRLFHRAIVAYGKLIEPEELGIQEGRGSEYRAASRLVMSRIMELRDPKTEEK